jgi:DNA-binding NtrC family response regulator
MTGESAVRKTSVLLVDDDASTRASLSRNLVDLGCEVRSGGSAAEGRALLERATSDLSFIDLHLPDGTGDVIVRQALLSGRTQRAYCMMGRGTSRNVRNVVHAMRSGCMDVLEKPFDEEQVRALIHAWKIVGLGDLSDWRRRYAPSLIGEDAQLLEVLQVLRSVARTDSTVFITGESGTGKELAARAVHDASSRRDGPFVALNCAAIPDTLVEAELFGHARGAFTGAAGVREGRIAAAHGGTLFLDEVGDMPLAAQAKLLRVLQERCITPLGSDRPVSVDVRVVAATNRDLEVMVEASTFRRDLFFRLSVIPVFMPPLRERVGDIYELARFFLHQTNLRTGGNVCGFDPSAIDALCGHAWPGNIRELVNVIERAVVLKVEGQLQARDLRLSGKSRLTPPPGRISRPPELVDLNLQTAIEGTERRLIEQALAKTKGNRTEAAALLGLNRTTLVEKLRKHKG